MKLEERISKLHSLSQDYEKLASIVKRMETNENAPVWDSEWAYELMTNYNQVLEHMKSLRGDLGL